MAGTTEEPPSKSKRQRRVLNFPQLTFQEALDFATALFEQGSGQPVRRLTLFNALDRSPESSLSRTLITAASKYSLIRGNPQSEQLELTSEGLKCVDPSYGPREQTRAKIDSAITSVIPFNGLYERFANAKLPSKAVLLDTIKQFDVSEEAADQAVDIFIVNLRSVGLLQTLSGAERIVTIDHLLEALPASAHRDVSSGVAPIYKPIVTQEHAEFDRTVFYVTPIGSDGSAQRKHSDLFLSTLVEPALESFELKVVRADGIDKPGTITKQIIELLLKARLVIADLSFHNPNVFYELAIRHMTRKPVVQLIQKSDSIPFDVSQMRTIVIDNTDIYTFTPKIEFYRSEIANQVRRSLEEPDAADNPVAWVQKQD
jgi:hypothetical protein